MCENSSGKKFYMVLVGALNVGVMQVSFEPNIKTNAVAHTQTIYEYKDLYLNKGDDFGCFEMGSTIVILAQKGMLELEDLVGKDVKYGETIAKNV
jgi:phosphatidylserine decarboxylase